MVDIAGHRRTDGHATLVERQHQTDQRDNNGPKLNRVKIGSPVGVFCSMHFMPMHAAISTSGMAMTKIRAPRQHCGHRAADGRADGRATVMTSDPTPINRPIFERGDCSRMMLIINGVGTPEPMP